MIPKPTFDGHGGITEDTAAAIATYQGDETAWLDYITGVWNLHYGWSNRTSSDDTITWEFVTGGWSGNDSIIRAMQDNAVMWPNCWESSHRGGKYVFTVDR